MKHSNIKMLAPIAISALLAACGGGGGGDSSNGDTATKPTPPQGFQVTADNQDNVAKTALSTINNSVASIGSQLVSSDSTAATVDNRRFAAAANMMPAAVFQNTFPCQAGGQFTTKQDDADNSSTVSVGDNLGIAYDNCDNNGVVIHGAIDLLVKNVTGQVGSSTYAVQAAVNVPAPGLTTSKTINGKTETTSAAGQSDLVISRTAAGVKTELTIANLQGKNGNDIWRYSDMKLVSTKSGTTRVAQLDGMIHLTLGSNTGDLKLNMSAPSTPFTFSSGQAYPDSGEMRVTSGNGTLTLTAQPNGILQMKLETNGQTSNKVATWCSIMGC
ncbi:hypothetical protein [Chitinivorax sp. B]|uniref:hypothetical protein n=1 Tax=Chitinivorax sp. B TaxID=2502235 RepID=UPI0010F6B682|nr:hypothetical protein [Chitinivorax sp. B]